MIGQSGGSQQAAEFGRQLLGKRLSDDGLQESINAGCVIDRDVAARDSGIQALSSDACLADRC